MPGPAHACCAGFGMDPGTWREKASMVGILETGKLEEAGVKIERRSGENASRGRVAIPIRE